jgi:hypothetical protein
VPQLIEIVSLFLLLVADESAVFAHRVDLVGDLTVNISMDDVEIVWVVIFDRPEDHSCAVVYATSQVAPASLVAGFVAAFPSAPVPSKANPTRRVVGV